MMKRNNWKVLAVLSFGLLGLLAGMLYLSPSPPTPHLADAICQPSDLGDRYHHTQPPTLTDFRLGHTIVETYTVSLIDNQLSNTILDCHIIRYPNEAEAHQVFESLCTNKQSTPVAGDEACTFVSNAPTNLAFRRNEFLVLMSGDVAILPAPEVDARLRPEALFAP